MHLPVRLNAERAALASRVREVSVRGSGTAASRKPDRRSVVGRPMGLPLAEGTGVGLARRLAPFDSFAVRNVGLRRYGTAAVAPRSGSCEMQKDALTVAIATLQKLREIYHSQLDASVLAELDDVLELLKQQFERLEVVRRGELEGRVFRIFAMVLRIVTNITDLMDRWQ